jgi:hypothetical protein
MLVSLDSKIETTNGTFLASELVSRADLKEFKLHSQKNILNNIKIIDKSYNLLNPMTLQRVGKGQCIKIETYLGYECILPEKLSVNTSLEETKPASLLQAGDSILLTGNYSDITTQLPVLVSTDFTSSGRILVNEVLAELAGLVFTHGNLANSEIFITNIPAEFVSDRLRNYLVDKAVVFNILSKNKESVSIKIHNIHLIDILTALGGMKKDSFPEFLWKSPRNVGYSFLKIFFKDKMIMNEIYTMHIDLMKDLQNYLFTRFGVITKFDRKLIFNENFLEILKNIVDEKRTLSDINADINHSLVTANEIVFYLKDFITKVEVLERELFDIAFEEETSSISIGNVL